MLFKGRKILVGITGSIAAYKSVILVRSLVKEGAEVRVVMTPAAKDFVSALTLSTLSKNKVLAEIFAEEEWANHVILGRWADLIIAAPLSCNTLAKMANGLCDNLLLSIYLSATCPVILAPAMDEDMWKHPATQANIAKVASFGNEIIPVGVGELASGLNGPGRMAEPEEIITYLDNFLNRNKPLLGKKALVTAGPTYEPLDPVRFIGNHSSGKMGIAVAKELLKNGAEVTLVLGPVTNKFDLNGLNVIRVNTANEMYEACNNIFDTMDIAVMAAAVADYSPETVAAQKIKKAGPNLTLNLLKTKDILKSLGARKSKQVLVGFALETNNEEVNAKEKLSVKNADLIVLNSLQDATAGFGVDTNKVTIFDSSGKKTSFDTKTKEAVAKDIVDSIIAFKNA